MNSITVFSTGRLRRATLLSLVFAAFASLGLAQARVDPDPDIFDGTKTKKDQAKQDKNTTIDDWEGPNLIIYDSKEKGSAKGGAGLAGMEGPGMDVGVPGGTGMGGIGLPLPLGGAGAGASQPSLPSLQIPTGQQASAQNSTSGMPPGSNPSLAGAAESMGGRPSDVKIGDPSQKIATSAQGKAGNVAAPAEGGEPSGEKAGEAAGEIPNTASGGSQSGNRGSGVEKGDAMPSDM
jgi:hypothetical protein